MYSMSSTLPFLSMQLLGEWWIVGLFVSFQYILIRDHWYFMIIDHPGHALPAEGSSCW